MLAYPKRSKFKKLQKGKSFNRLNNNLSLKSLKLKTLKIISLDSGRVSAKQLNSIKLLIKKSIKKKGHVIFKIFPQTPITKKPSEIRMGKGKGNVDHWVSKLKVGTILFEIKVRNLFKNKIINTLKKVQVRLPINTKIF